MTGSPSLATARGPAAIDRVRAPSAMYTACLHCHASLGANTAIEHFATGRRLAFDAAKGRLWVVCRHCRRWNLTPLEERWEAIEECERLYRSTRIRVSTDNIGLARVAEGLELIRIGAPPGPEIAAWRYAADFRQRWLTRAAPLATGTVAGYGVQMLFNSHVPWTPAAILPLLAVIGIGGSAAAITSLRRSFSSVVLPDGRRTIWLRGAKELRLARLYAGDAGWGVRLGPLEKSPSHTGTQAIHTLRSVTTATNYYGGRTREIGTALGLLADVGDPGRYISRLARAGPAHGYFGIATYPPEIRLALEMALHDDVERRALSGELATLQAEWAMAEEIARIADNLLLPANVTEQYDSLNKGSDD